MLQGTRKRTAMTLVELLVVMAIIVIFTAITAAFYPANQADRELSRFSNTVQSALLSARNRAKAERLPTGIRFYADPNSLTKVGSVVLIQKPAPLDAYAIGGAGNPGSLSANIVERTPPPMSGIFDAYITFPNNYPIQNVLNYGDFIVLDSGDVAKIDGLVTPPTMTNPNTAYSASGSYSSGFSSSLTALPTKFKVYRSPVELSGDTPFELSNIIEIQMPNSPRFPLPSFTQASYSPTQQPAPAVVNQPLYFEIIFNPDGSLNNSTADVYLHLHNFESLFATGPSYSYGNFSKDAILAVRKMSGSIGVYEVGQPIDFTPIDFSNLYNPANHNPYLFAKDPRNKGI
jgi:prepilin-type N-terminal cleavage/methylation domain-containing protein